MTDPAARRPVRMCTRCERTTEDPVLVHEVPAATVPASTCTRARNARRTTRP